MKYRIFLTNQAKRDLINFPLSIQRRIVDKLEYFEKQPKPFQYAKKLKNSHLGSYRFRIGDYRAIFDVEKDGTIHVLMVLRIKHRKDIYVL